MRIRVPELIENGHQVQMRSLVESKQGQEYFWLSVDREYAEFLTPERQDAFLVAMLPWAMRNGEDIQVDGAVSERLFYSLTNYFMRAMSIVVPGLCLVKILPAQVLTERVSGARGGVVTGLSGGIDSFCVVADHLFGEVPPGFKLTHLMMNNVGSYEPGGREVFRRRYEHLSLAAREMGLPFVVVDTNLHESGREPAYWQIPTSRNVVCVLALQRLFGRYLVASSNRYQVSSVRPPRPPPWPMTTTCESDPIMVPLLSTETTECISAGCQYARTEKTQRVADVPITYRYLDVCTDHLRSGDGNCSVCPKCARTQFTLELLGKLQLYEKIFDLDRYRRIRRRYLLKVLTDRCDLMREIKELAKERGFRFPLFFRIVAPFIRVVEWIFARISFILAPWFHRLAVWLRPHVPVPVWRAAKRLLKPS